MSTWSGIWRVVYAEMNNQDITNAFANETMEIEHGNYKILAGDTISDKGQLTFFEGTNNLDILGTEGPNKGKLFQCIYKTEDESMQICYGQIQRPTKFETSPENKFVLLKWKRK